MKFFPHQSDSKFLVIFLLSLWAIKTNSLCADSQWECDNGDCIELNERCDGAVQCNDRSDEIAANCIHQKCPATSFRCAYGACVRNGTQCDGRIDCADESDELQRFCGNHTDFDLKLRGECGAQQLQCVPGSCIDLARKCDGKIDCINGADETVAVCGLRKCPAGVFQCGYGACLNADAYCNATVECYDGSDESFELCGYQRTLNILPNVGASSVFKTTRAPLRTTTFRTPTNSSWCELPRYSPNLIISDLRGNPVEGSVKKGTIVRYSCHEGYKLANSAIESSYCDGPDLHQLNDCEKPCDTSVIVKDFTKMATCQLERHSYNCEEAKSVRPGTAALIQCATYFYSPTRSRLIASQECTAKGEWTIIWEKCAMHCGTTVQTFPLAANAIDVLNSEIPWHVGIYTNVNERTFNYTCGGTIISPLLVLTAAHCVFDVVDGAARPANEFQVIASKFFKDYYHTEGGSQLRNVSRIIVHNDYKHFDVFQNDLALLVLDRHLKFGRAIRPICFDHSAEQADSYGKLGAWGMSENAKLKNYEVLQVVSGEHYNYAKCREFSSNEVLTQDKFCAKSISGMACRGDSGGGYFIHNPKTNLHYLKGVLSSASATDTAGCANSDTILYLIDVHQFKDWINQWRNIEENNYVSGTVPLVKTVSEINSNKTESSSRNKLLNKDFVFPHDEDEQIYPFQKWNTEQQVKTEPPTSDRKLKYNKDFVFPQDD